MKRTTIKNDQLQIADRVVSLYLDGQPDLELGVQTVKQVKDGTVTMFRPYTHTADFSSTGGVICYVGVEEYQMEVDTDRQWILISRTTLR